MKDIRNLKKSFKVLAIDPSGYYKNKKATIGVAFCEWKEIGEHIIICKESLINLELSHFSIESEKDLETFYSYLETTLKTKGIDHVVIEDYILYGDKVGAQVWQQQPTSKTIGVIQHICNKYGVRNTLQIAAFVKRWSNKVLAWPTWGFLDKYKNTYKFNEYKTSDYKHAMDAFRHNFHFTLRENKMNQKKKIKEKVDL